MELNMESTPDGSCHAFLSGSELNFLVQTFTFMHWPMLLSQVTYFELKWKMLYTFYQIVLLQHYLHTLRNIMHACTVCSFNRLLTTELCRMLIVSCALNYDDAIRACAVSTVMADRTGKFVLLTYSLTASHCFTEAHLAGVPFPRSCDFL